MLVLQQDLVLHMTHLQPGNVFRVAFFHLEIHAFPPSCPFLKKKENKKAQKEGFSIAVDYVLA